MRFAGAAAVLVGCWLAMPGVRAGQDAGERPLLRPSRDVAVTYRSSQSLEQRTRWLAAAKVVRIESPTPGLYVIIDYAARRMSVVRDEERSVIEMAVPEGATGVAGGSDTRPYIRRGDDVVAGVGCTDWETTDRNGRRTLACITADGVLLRVRAGGQTLAIAVSVRYAPQDPALFRVPADYARRKPGDVR
jgi:hypothetical protein